MVVSFNSITSPEKLTLKEKREVTNNSEETLTQATLLNNTRTDSFEQTSFSFTDLEKLEKKPIELKPFTPEIAPKRPPSVLDGTGQTVVDLTQDQVDGLQESYMVVSEQLDALQNQKGIIEAAKEQGLPIGNHYTPEDIAQLEESIANTEKELKMYDSILDKVEDENYDGSYIFSKEQANFLRGEGLKGHDTHHGEFLVDLYREVRNSMDDLNPDSPAYTAAQSRLDTIARQGPNAGDMYFVHLEQLNPDYEPGIGLELINPEYDENGDLTNG